MPGKSWPRSAPGGTSTRRIRRHPQPGGGYLPKHLLVHAYRELTRAGEWPFDAGLLRRIRMKPVRTLSGVTTVTVLTKPYPCPGECIFCPTDARMPKSYLPDEPGARRASSTTSIPSADRLPPAGAEGHRPPDRQGRAAHPRRDLERLSAADYQ